MSRFAITIENLTKAFPAGNSLPSLLLAPFRARGTEVVRDISLEIAPGEVFGLLGPNGAGKTTLVEILATLLLPTRGEVRVCGYDVVRQAMQVRKVVGYCPATAESFYPRLTGWDNLQFFALLHGLPAREAQRRITGTLNLVGMDGARAVPFQRLSQGMKQRLALVRALLTDPSVVLLDEPTKSLDPLLQVELGQFLRRDLAGRLGKTIVMVTHSLAEAESVCHRIAILNQGRLVALGTPQEIQKRLGGTNLAAAYEKALRAES